MARRTFDVIDVTEVLMHCGIGRSTRALSLGFSALAGSTRQP